MTGSLLITTVGLGGMVILMYWLAAVAKRRLGVGAGTVSASQLRVVGKRTLEPRKSLYVVEVGDRYILVGTGEQGVSLVDHITADEFARMSAPAPEGGVAAPRPSLPLARALRRRGLAARVGAGTAETDSAGKAHSDDDSADLQGQPSEDATTDAQPFEDAPASAEAVGEQRFMTVGESFSHFLGKARGSRGARERVAAQAADAAEDEDAQG